MHPPWLTQKLADGGIIMGSTATFGAPFYNDRVLGRLVYGESQQGRLHCSEDDYSIDDMESYHASSNSEKVRLINIVLVKRGKCSFTRKVSVAAKKGAHAVIIIDKDDSPYTAQDLKNIIVADDGYGENIQIPSILISKTDGKELLAAVQSHAPVVVELAWNLPTNHVVTVDLWMSSASRESMKFLKAFTPNRRTLNEVMEFQPHFVVFGMDQGNPGIFQGLCRDNDGKYCAEDPDGAGPVSGKDVIDEDLRQLCIHKVHRVSRTSARAHKAGKAGGIVYSEVFWSYIEKFADECKVDGSGDRQFGEACSTRVMIDVNVDAQKVANCIRHDSDALLEEQKNYQAWSPRALRINGWRYAGIMDTDLVTRAICSGFIEPPAECLELVKKRDPITPWNTQTQQGVTFWEMIMWLGLVIVGIMGGLVAYRRYLKKEMRTTLREEVMLEVQAQIGEYSKMMGQ